MHRYLIIMNKLAEGKFKVIHPTESEVISGKLSKQRESLKK